MPFHQAIRSDIYAVAYKLKANTAYAVLVRVDHMARSVKDFGHIPVYQAKGGRRDYFDARAVLEDARPSDVVRSSTQRFVTFATWDQLIQRRIEWQDMAIDRITKKRAQLDTMLQRELRVRSLLFAQLKGNPNASAKS